jgi:hypothetical protein
VTVVSGQIKESTAAIQGIAGGSRQIVGAVKKIDELGRNSASEAQSVSAAAEEQLAAMEEIASSSEALARLARTCRRLSPNSACINVIYKRLPINSRPLAAEFIFGADGESQAQRHCTPDKCLCTRDKAIMAKYITLL